MAKIHWTARALRNLDELLAGIAEDDPDSLARIAQHIDQAVLRLESFPESAPFYQEPFRRLAIQKLPYSCYYLFLNDTVFILSIRHDSRKPWDAREGRQDI